MSSLSLERTGSKGITERNTRTHRLCHSFLGKQSMLQNWNPQSGLPIYFSFKELIPMFSHYGDTKMLRPMSSDAKIYQILFLLSLKLHSTHHFFVNIHLPISYVCRFIQQCFLRCIGYVMSNRKMTENYDQEVMYMEVAKCKGKVFPVLN
jgi:hypothetical protein